MIAAQQPKRAADAVLAGGAVWLAYPIVWLFSEGFASFSVSFEVGCSARPRARMRSRSPADSNGAAKGRCASSRHGMSGGDGRSVRRESRHPSLAAEGIERRRCAGGPGQDSEEGASGTRGSLNPACAGR